MLMRRCISGVALALVQAAIAVVQAQSMRPVTERKFSLDSLPRVRVTVLVDNTAGWRPVLGE